MPPVNAFVCTVEIPSLDKSLSRNIGPVGAVVLSKMAIPGAGRLAYAKAPDDDMFGLLQPEQQAA
jgi:hypothetical protein